MDKLRLDKWLWAARFFKTRSLAKGAIEGGKVRVNGERPKVSKDITVGMELTIRRGFDEQIVEVLVLSDQRRGAPEAALLYRETAASLAARAEQQSARKAMAGEIHTDGRPNKKQRRQIHRFVRRTVDESDD
ncbi:RNA-binding protein [Simiduia sp. 21SJ11W-1]|uniref:RNA-binding S4 domain-containing protein n=1 Tax=Simiduia sp. 21SJ11W-1 TaxID=2909669 RepID=UPI0020A1B8DC|nr:S4 domain-containing protein [Simiduia sp. 21SJ11W-1]UTA48080.1 RNA-binding protein [Simiduia sp. 21SJ11W-1]